MSRRARPRSGERRLVPMVIVPAGCARPPEPHEISAAWMLARHFGTVIEFLCPSEGYKMKTADLVLNGLIWEMKSPTGNARMTVSNQFRRASKQSTHVVFDARRVHLSEDYVLSQVRIEMKKRRFKAVLFITKAGTVLEIRPT